MPSKREADPRTVYADCDHVRLRLVRDVAGGAIGPWRVECGACGGVGPERSTDAGAVEAWLLSCVGVEDAPSEDCHIDTAAAVLEPVDGLGLFDLAGWVEVERGVHFPPHETEALA